MTQPKSPCPDCNSFNGTPGYVWQFKKKVPCKFCAWYGDGKGWILYPQAHIVAPDRKSPEGAVATLLVERAKGAFERVDLNAFQARQLVIDLLPKIPIKGKD